MQGSTLSTHPTRPKKRRKEVTVIRDSKEMRVKGHPIDQCLPKSRGQPSQDGKGGASASTCEVTRGLDIGSRDCHVSSGMRR
jgi:hypothetical protein